MVGAAVLALAWMRGRSAVTYWSPGLRYLAWAWGVSIVGGCVWELSQFIIGLRHPQGLAYPLSDLLDPVLASWLGRAAFITLWLGLGGYLLSRGRR